MESGRKFSTPQQQNREKGKTQLLLTFSAKDFISFSLSKYRILAASEKDIQQYAFSAQAAISSLKKETMAKNIGTEERNFWRWLWDINWACHISVWLTVQPTEMLCPSQLQKNPTQATESTWTTLFLRVISRRLPLDKMELDKFWEQSNSTRSLWHT